MRGYNLSKPFNNLLNCFFCELIMSQLSLLSTSLSCQNPFVRRQGFFFFFFSTVGFFLSSSVFVFSFREEWMVIQCVSKTGNGWNSPPSFRSDCG